MIAFIGTSFVFAAGAFAPVVAEPQKWGPPEISYRQWLTFSDGSGSTKVRLFYTPDRQRLDYTRDRHALVTVIDAKAKVIFSLNPSRKLYQSVPYKPVSLVFNVNGLKAKRRRIADEAIDGIPATKYFVDSQTTYGDRYEGFAWITDQRVVLKLDGTVIRGSRKRRLFMSSKDLKIGALPDKIFALPKDYKAVGKR